MNNKIIIGVIVILIIGGGFYLMQNKSNSTSTTSQNQTTGELANESSEFAKAIESGKPTICTMTKDADSMEYSIKGKKMRIKTTNTVSDEKGTPITTVGHIISDEKYFYTWDEVTKQGSKMSLVAPSAYPQASIAPLEKTPKFDSQDDYENLKNEGYTINCKSGIIDDAVFTPPSDIKFFDPTEMMKAFPSPKADGSFDAKQLEELQRQYGNE